MSDTAADGVPGGNAIPGMTGTAPATPGAGERGFHSDRQPGAEARLANGHARAEGAVRPPYGHLPSALGGPQHGPQHAGAQQPGDPQPGDPQPGGGQPGGQPDGPQPGDQPGGQQPAGQQPGAGPAGTAHAPGGTFAGPQAAGAAPAAAPPADRAPAPPSPLGGVAAPQQAGPPAAHQPGGTGPDPAAPTSRIQQRGPGRGDGAERGRTKIAEEVVEKIAGLAARHVQGVHSLGGDVARALGSIRERIGLGESSKAQGVSVEMAERRVIVDLVIVVEYGYVIMEVATAVRANVINAVERMLGLQVIEVNIAVDDVHMPEDEDEPDRR